MKKCVEIHKIECRFIETHRCSGMSIIGAHPECTTHNNPSTSPTVAKTNRSDTRDNQPKSAEDDDEQENADNQNESDNDQEADADADADKSHARNHQHTTRSHDDKQQQQTKKGRQDKAPSNMGKRDGDYVIVDEQNGTPPPPPPSDTFKHVRDEQQQQQRTDVEKKKDAPKDDEARMQDDEDETNERPTLPMLKPKSVNPDTLQQMNSKKTVPEQNGASSSADGNICSRNFTR